ncbi:MAG: LysE family translocator [Microcoleaceae cyanobacterium]
MEEIAHGITLQALSALVVGVFVLASTPGPGVFATISCALASDFTAAVAVVVGTVLGDLIFLLFAIFGLTLVIQRFDYAFIAIKIFGSLYLSWLGYKFWTAEVIIPDNSNTKIEDRDILKNFTAGLTISLSNPKVIIFYSAFLPAFINPAELRLEGIAIISAMIAMIVGGVLLLYALIASKAKSFFQSEVAMRNLNRTAAGILLGVAVLIVFVE